MANLSITNVCNKQCVYCFANDTKNEYGKSYMDEHTFDMALAYLKRSGLMQVRLLGGEPTLHPHFIEFVKKSLDNDFSIMLFTNGLMNNKVLEFLATIPTKKISILLNTIHPIENNHSGMERQQHTMRTLGRKVIAGVNLYSAKQELDYLLNYIKEFNLKKEIRLGISHPVLSQNNTFLHPKDYPKIGKNIVEFKYKVKANGIRLGFDCGFVPCMFGSEYFDLLSEELKKAGTCCHPIIDMLSDGSFISCYPLNNLKKLMIHDELDANMLIHSFEIALAPYKDIGIYPYCTSCQLFKSRCNGGCIASRMQRFFTERN